MQSESPQLKVSVGNGATVVELRGTFLDETVIFDSGQQLIDLVVETDQPRLVLDFSHVSHLSSSMVMTMLTSLHKRIGNKGGELHLCAIPPEIFRIFQIAQLDEVFHICQSRDEAVESICC